MIEAAEQYDKTLEKSKAMLKGIETLEGRPKELKLMRIKSMIDRAAQNMKDHTSDQQEILASRHSAIQGFEN